jgi:hypothetical protein
MNTIPLWRRVLPQSLVRWIDWKRDPAEHYREQHELLIRLARRCAFDFAHAADFISPTDPIARELGYQERAAWWVSVFQAGNPAKDYRNKILMELNTAELAVEQLITLCEKNNIEVPEGIMNRYRRPF